VTKRYYLTPDGTKVDQTAAEDHADVGRRVLADRGIKPKDYADSYDQMFNLGFARVVEFKERICAENPKLPLTDPQMAFLIRRQSDCGGQRELTINDKKFCETRRGGSLAHEELDGIQ